MLDPLAAKVSPEGNIDCGKLVATISYKTVDHVTCGSRYPFIGINKPKPIISCFRDGNIAGTVEIRNESVAENSVDDRFGAFNGAVGALHVDQNDLGHMGAQCLDTADNVLFFISRE